jgi:RNA polymerase sigma-70 factor (ECF subfamily)
VPSSEREQILAALRERIVAFAASRISRDVAEDLAQEVLILLHEKYAHVQRLDELLPLSLQIVRFKMMGLHRKSSRRGEYTQVSVDEIQLPDDEFDPSVYVERREMLDRLTTAITGLGDRCKTIFRLKLEGRTFEEIREIMGAATINTVYTWDFRCRKQLLDRLGGSWDVKK